MFIVEVMQSNGDIFFMQVCETEQIMQLLLVGEKASLKELNFMNL